MDHCTNLLAERTVNNDASEYPPPVCLASTGPVSSTTGSAVGLHRGEATPQVARAAHADNASSLQPTATPRDTLLTSGAVTLSTDPIHPTAPPATPRLLSDSALQKAKQTPLASLHEPTTNDLPLAIPATAPPTAPTAMSNLYIGESTLQLAAQMPTQETTGSPLQPTPHDPVSTPLPTRVPENSNLPITDPNTFSPPSASTPPIPNPKPTPPVTAPLPTRPPLPSPENTPESSLVPHRFDQDRILPTIGHVIKIRFSQPIQGPGSVVHTSAASTSAASSSKKYKYHSALVVHATPNYIKRSFSIKAYPIPAFTGEDFAASLKMLDQTEQDHYIPIPPADTGMTPAAFGDPVMPTTRDENGDTIP
ncbi:hypothetical protein K440DRAFT_665369 [Wilcoxina mikolae CBS 423.85]|nr:hypothetical protein K440DRAFT_665369 [Wilcoxina mikolae CBS 423.85]